MENILNNLYIVAGLILALILLYAGATYLWNRKFVPAQLVRGKLVKPLGKIIKEINTYTFKEDTGSLLKKGNPKAQKILSYRNLHLAIIAAGIIAYLLTGTWYWLLALPLSFIIGLSRAMPVIQKRTKILDRIFLIASSSIKFTAGPRAKNAPPPASWNHLTVEKWNKEIPVKMIITFPSGNGPEKNAQKTFQNSFEANVTDENIWNFEWDLHHDRVTIEAAPHLPTQLAYPGSEGAKWSVFPVGESSEGVASYDVATFPHVLVAGPSGTGKTMCLTSHLFSANKGWITVGDLEVGDTVFGKDGKPTKVTHLHPIITPNEAYKVTFRNGETIVVDADHLWETETYAARRSRFANTNEEKDKVRAHRFSKEIITRIENEITNASDADTISISELAELLDTYPERNYLYQLAKRVGPAEEIHPTQVFHYGSQIVKQNQMVTRLDFREFSAWYNSRKETSPTKKFPLLRGHFDKLNQLAYELRDSDVLTVDSVLEYLDVWQKLSADWIRANIDITLPAPAMVKDLREKAEGKYNTLPAQILVPVEDQNGMISKQDVSALLGLPLEAIESLWSNARRRVATQTKQRELVELRVSEKTVSRTAPSYFKYPKKLILANVVKDNTVALNDQRDKLSSGVSIVTTREIADKLKTDHGFANHYVSKNEPIEFPTATLPIHPYVFGAWLGDGYSRKGSICGIDHELFDRCTSLGYTYTDKSWANRQEGKHEDFRLLDFPRLHQELGKEKLLLSGKGKSIRRDGEVKHIPAAYFTSSIEQRRELLRGLLDTDGSVSKNGGDINLHSSNEVLAKDVKRLIASLGYIPYFRSKVPTYTHNGEKRQGKLAYTVSFQADPADLLFGLSRKNEAHVKAFRGDRLDYRTHTIVSVERVESVPMRCISVDAPDRLFLVSDSLIPTHNSVLQRNIVFHTIQHNDRWRFLGVDLKRVELTPYNKYKKTVMGIATDVEQGVAVLKYAYNEMMDRYKAMEDMGVNNVMDMADPPYCILLMIDEATMFLGASGSKTDEGKAEDALKGEASDLVGKILRLGRASGVHMLIAMQRPDATVLRGEFKANMDVRMAAGRMDSTPSAMVLDSGEAVNLPGIRGRGLIRVGGSLTTFQGYFAPQDWIDEFILKHPEAEPSTIAPGGHLHDKYMATKRLAAKAAEEAANPTAAADGDAPAADSPAPDSSDNSDKPRGLKGLKGLRRKDSSAPEAPVTPPVPAPVAELEAPEPDGFEVDFSDDSLSSSIGDISFEDVPLTENQKALLDSLHRKEDATLDVEVNDIPDFFTGSAKSEKSGPKRTIEPDLQLNDDDFILDDFEEEDEEEEELPTPPADIMPTPAGPVKPQVKHEWVAASPFGDSPAPAATPKKVQAPVAPTVEESPAPVVPQRPTLPSRPVRPAPAQPGVVRPQRPASPFNPNSGGGGGVSGNPFLPKK